MMGLVLLTVLEPFKGMEVSHRDANPVDVELLSGGPDGYGYTYLSTQDGDAGVTFNYIDISTTGMAMGAGDDWCSGSSASTLYYLGFTFPFYTESYDSVSICSNGAIVFDTPYVYFGLSNTALPSASYNGPRAFVAVMWDDLDPPEYGGDVYFQSFTSCPDGYSGACAVVQYHNVPRFGDATLMDFEIILYDNGNIKLQYNSAIYYNDATIGIQGDTANSTNNFFLEYVYNGTPATHVPDSGTAILFVHPTSTDVVERSNDITPSLRVVGRTLYAESGSVYDAAGRFVATFRGSYTLRSKGVFFVRVKGKVYRILAR